MPNDPLAWDAVAALFTSSSPSKIQNVKIASPDHQGSKMWKVLLPALVQSSSVSNVTLGQCNIRPSAARYFCEAFATNHWKSINLLWNHVNMDATLVKMMSSIFHNTSLQSFSIEHKWECLVEGTPQKDMDRLYKAVDQTSLASVSFKCFCASSSMKTFQEYATFRCLTNLFCNSVPKEQQEILAAPLVARLAKPSKQHQAARASLLYDLLQSGRISVDSSG
jgi:hypothetical protein